MPFDYFTCLNLVQVLTLLCARFFLSLRWVRVRVCVVDAFYSSATIVHLLVLLLLLNIPCWTHSLNRIYIFGVCSIQSVRCFVTSVLLLPLHLDVIWLWMWYSFNSLSSTFQVLLLFSCVEYTHSIVWMWSVLRCNLMHCTPHCNNLCVDKWVRISNRVRVLVE